MKKYFSLLRILALLVLLPLPAMADTEDGAAIAPAVVAPLMQWVEQELGVKVPVLPRVVASHTQLRKILVHMGGRFMGRPQSLYVPGTIYMDSNTWDPEDSTQQSLLVHELVHHAQLFMTSVAWPCANAKEQQAYTLQNHWLEQHGHEPFVTVAWVQRVAACENGTGATSLLAQR